MNTVALVGRPQASRIMPAALEVIDFLMAKGVKLKLHHEFAEMLAAVHANLGEHEVFTSADDLLKADLMLSIGGDGTFLQSVTYAAPLGIPILGVNAGRLGFLSTLQVSELQQGWDILQAGQYKLENRTLLKLCCDQNPFGINNFALNEFTVTRRDTASMLVVNTWINGQELNSYWADGLIISTPTGSTGYSLSCGGPLMLPDAENFIITPVSPHNLATRPIVVPDGAVIEIEVEGPTDRFLVSLDSRSTRLIDRVRLTIKKAAFPAILIKLPEQSYLQTLRSKLNWGYDVRN